MKVIRTRVAVLVASCGLLVSAFGLTVITASPAVAGASVATLSQCPSATVIEAGPCLAI